MVLNAYMDAKVVFMTKTILECKNGLQVRGSFEETTLFDNHAPRPSCQKEGMKYTLFEISTHRRSSSWEHGRPGDL